MNPIAVLIVEDSPEVGEIWSRFLREPGYVVDIATTMASALVKIRRIPPHDIVFLDLSLPDTANKEETLKFIDVAKAMNPNVKMIVATGYATEQIKELALAMGADGFESKNDMTSQVALYRIIKRQFEHCRDSRAAVERQVEIQEQLSRLIPVDRPNTQPFRE